MTWKMDEEGWAESLPWKPLSFPFFRFCVFFSVCSIEMYIMRKHNKISDMDM
eukprot:Gb_09646 [translate_table: standard]